MSELTVLLAQQGVPFIVAFRAVHAYYGCSVTKFAQLWNWAKSL